MIYFGGEDTRQELGAVDIAKAMVADTTHLVVIGYRFHESNRLIDAAILQSMPHLKKIYIQTKGDFELVKERIEEGIFDPDYIKERRIEIIPQNDLNEFYKPAALKSGVIQGIAN